MSLTDDIIKTEVERHVQLYNIEQLKRRLFNCFKDYTNQYVDAGRLLLYSDSLSSLTITVTLAVPPRCSGPYAGIQLTSLPSISPE